MTLTNQYYWNQVGREASEARLQQAEQARKVRLARTFRRGK